MSSRFYPSLSSALWSQTPPPEWLPDTGEVAWRQTLSALLQLWQDVGGQGAVIHSQGVWIPSHRAEDLPPEWRDHHWVFSADLSPAVLADPAQTLIPLMPRDPLRQEEFLLILNPAFAALVLRGVNPHLQGGMMISFDPEVLQRAWDTLQLRIHQVRTDCLLRWEKLQERYPWPDPHHRIMSRFSSLVMLAMQGKLPPPSLPPVQRQLPASTPDYRADDIPPAGASPPAPEPPRPEDPEATKKKGSVSETELLRALAHEVLTPLATIRTLVRLLLRRQDLPPSVRQHVEKIDLQCTEQIDRFNLFLQATELDLKSIRLEVTPLVDLIHHNLDHWQELVHRRGSHLQVEVPVDLPNVVSDPHRLDALLTGVIDRIARISPPGSHIAAQLVTMGEQVKLQFQVTPEMDDSLQDEQISVLGLMPPQAIGQLLVLQPDTGAISLSIPVTQTLFRALGGYLTVKQKAQQGETVTIFLPCHP